MAEGFQSCGEVPIENPFFMKTLTEKFHEQMSGW